MIDTHAHIYLKEFKEDIHQVIDRALEKGVTKILLPNIDRTTIEDMLSLEEHYPDVCHAMMGLHPCSVKEDFEHQLYEVESWLSKRKFIALGEMGTDLYWDKTTWDIQKEAFKIQCDLAKKHELPLVIHCRESIDETITLLKNDESQSLTGVFHCFTGTPEQGKTITEELKFYLGLGGVTTFKNSGLDLVVPHLNRDKLVLETDSPYLSPVPERGKRNEPYKVKFVADKLATLLNLSVEEVASFTSDNANRLFFE
ncbi:MAG: TatD family hydrolase [Bacteroidota bacterium]